jgi:hypothetical protein
MIVVKVNRPPPSNSPLPGFLGSVGANLCCFGDTTEITKAVTMRDVEEDAASLTTQRVGLVVVKVATGTGMTGEDSTIPAPIPASPRPRQSPLAYREGGNGPHPR